MCSFPDSSNQHHNPTNRTYKEIETKMNTLLPVLIKQTKSAIKVEHHIELLQQAIMTRYPPKGLRPRVNPRILDNKEINFLVEWNHITTEAAISYTMPLLKHWESVQVTVTENISNKENMIAQYFRKLWLSGSFLGP